MNPIFNDRFNEIDSEYQATFGRDKAETIDFTRYAKTPYVDTFDTRGGRYSEKQPSDSREANIWM